MKARTAGETDDLETILREIRLVVNDQPLRRSESFPSSRRRCRRPDPSAGLFRQQPLKCRVDRGERQACVAGFDNQVELVRLDEFGNFTHRSAHVSCWLRQSQLDLEAASLGVYEGRTDVP